MNKAVLVAVISLALASPCGAEPYADWLATCKSYRDVAEWLGANFRWEPDGLPGQGLDRLRNTPVRSAGETFRRRAGASLDAAVFTRESLNRINPAYRAEVIQVTAGESSSHFVCGFQLGGRLFVMDYGNPHEKRTGTHGPFRSPGEYVERLYPKKTGARAEAYPHPARGSEGIRKVRPGSGPAPAVGTAP